MHLTRYVHLNPVTAHIVENPKNWEHSSYQQYLGNANGKSICKFADLMDLGPDQYKEFAEDRIGYQRELANIKALMLE